MPPVLTSIFELFKAGPGPSSSHTIGPMRAGLEFRRELAALPPEVLARGVRLEAEFLGSLSATGRGHGSDRAVLAGLLGWAPEEVDPAAFAALGRPDGPPLSLEVAGRRFPVSPDTVVFGPLEHDHPHPNTLILRLWGPEGVLLERVYYSVGGGFLEGRGPAQPLKSRPAYPYASLAELLEILARTGLPLGRVLMANEEAITGAAPAEITAGMHRILGLMEDAVERGLAAAGKLPGPLGLDRKAGILYARARWQAHAAERWLILMNAYALAASEENAAGGLVVTAPTLGSSGVIPAALHLLKYQMRLPAAALLEPLWAAAAVGFLIRHNASIAGAEVGCQGEIGAASSMAAALFALALGHGVEVMASAAEIALEHYLGLTCDPVGGYVQIPCIERNAMGVVKAYNACLLASAGDPRRQKVGFDTVVKVMLQTGRDMSTRYKETSLGGLAANVPCC
ncbi:MAG: L-serine ammonia-lyase [Deltaproteobacteria bacterium]|nr:L-serine ammonia-lyase [Deltaproteobacteria bacterium]